MRREASDRGIGGVAPVRFVAYTDGACSPNPGRGGWGVVMLAYKGSRIVKRRELKGGELRTTNNRMELTAAIKALSALQRPCSITLVTDSMYVKNGITKWIKGWKKRNWMRGDRPVKNIALWKELDALCVEHNVTWEWTRGHVGTPENERADQLAKEGSEEAGRA